MPAPRRSARRLPAAAAAPAERPAILFAADGMRPDLVDRYSAAGGMPNMRELLRRGVEGRNGLTQGFPPNTGVGWYTLATGAWPGKHGSTNNTFHQTGTDFSRGTSFTSPGVLQADSIASAAERAGRKVAQLDWVAGRQANIAGPTVDYTNFFSNRGALAAPADPDEQAGAARFGLSCQPASFEPASGWSNVPAGDPATPPQQATLTVPTTFAAQNPDRVYDVYVYDSRADDRRAYNRVLLVPAAAAKDAAQAAATLREGRFEEIRLHGADGLIGTRAGQSAGFYVKLIDLTADLSGFKLYFTSVARAVATCRPDACAASRPAAPARTTLRSTLPTTCRPGSRPTSPRLRLRSSTRTPTSSRPATWRPATATRWSSSCSASCSPTPTWPWSATRLPTSSATSSSA